MDVFDTGISQRRLEIVDLVFRYTPAISYERQKEIMKEVSSFVENGYFDFSEICVKTQLTEEEK